MREDRYSARTPAIRDLFAERQVYVRAGMTSRYVTISRALQIWATLGVAVLVAWLGLASYTAVAKHLEAVAQGREVARLEAVTKALQAKIEATEADRSAPAAAPTSDLAVKLAEAKEGRERALTLAKASAAESAELRRELALAEDQRRELKSDLNRQTIVAKLADLGPDGAASKSDAMPVTATLIAPLNRSAGQSEGAGCAAR
jgi:hypothetical protein